MDNTDATNNQIETVATAVHGSLAFGHALGVLHNLRKKNYAQVALHALVCAYDIWAVTRHVQSLKEKAK